MGQGVDGDGPSGGRRGGVPGQGRGCRLPGAGCPRAPTGRPAVAPGGAALGSAVLRGQAGRGGAGIVDCQRLSHEAGDVLDVSGLIPESYDLEVSSPGLDRELRTDREFAWAWGKDVRCWLREPVDGRLEFAGRLEAAGPERLAIAARDGQTAEGPPALLPKARLDPAFRG